MNGRAIYLMNNSINYALVFPFALQTQIDSLSLVFPQEIVWFNVLVNLTN